MGTIIPVVAVIFFLGFLANRLNKKDSDEGHGSNDVPRSYDEAVTSMYESARESPKQNSQQSMDSMEQDNEQNQVDRSGLMFKILSNLGCQPVANDDGTVSVQYQGENFYMEFSGMYARIWDFMWTGIKADDPDLPKIREAVNIANFDFGPTVVMTKPNEEGVIGLHSRMDIMLHPACPENDTFVKSILNSFFVTKENVRNHFHQLSHQQTETQKYRRPVGLNTDNINFN